MSKIISSIVIGAFCFMAACGGGSPVDKLTGYTEKVLSILESNKADPAKAADAVAAFMKDNGAAIKAAGAEVEKWGNEMEEKYKSDPEGGAKAMAEMQAKMQPIMDRMKKLQEEAPELMKNEKIREVMSSLR